jgi:Zn-dependent peptidase ImmA (M78 family)
MPIENIADVEKVVRALRVKWNIGIDPIHNIIQLLEDHKIKIIELYDVDDRFDGLAAYANDEFPIIVVNGNFPVERKRFTLLHELGHLLLPLAEKPQKEQEYFCNKFASEFLLPKDNIIEEFGGKRDKITLTELIAIQKKYGISIPAIIYGLVNAKIISEFRQKQFYIRINSNQDLKNKVNLSRFKTPEKSNRYVRLVYRALAQESISISKASALLGKSIDAVRNDFALI